MITLEISNEILTRDYIASSDSSELFILPSISETIMYPPCKVATTENIFNLWGRYIKSIQGVDLEEGDTVLVKNQIDSSQNGVYRIKYKDPWIKVSSPFGSLWHVEDGEYTNCTFVVTDESPSGEIVFTQFSY